MTINQRGTPSSDTGRAALANMNNRQASELDASHRILVDAIANARVIQGGGTDVDGNGLGQMLQNAFNASLARMYPDFGLADNPKWDSVFTRAKAGDGDALTAIGYRGEVLDHPVVKRVQSVIGGEPGKSWAEVRTHFAKSTFGWPQEAVDGSVALLVLGGTVRASRDGKLLNAADLGAQQSAQIRLVGESAPITKGELLAVRGLMQNLGFTVKNDDDDTRARSRRSSLN